MTNGKGGMEGGGGVPDIDAGQAGEKSQAGEHAQGAVHADAVLPVCVCARACVSARARALTCLHAVRTSIRFLRMRMPVRREGGG